ncbi:ABC transporter permease [Pedobacter sp. L105]|uniref:MlaE family ABC transporter permease n=1 Tax=Pedobacter sp. L105 TaxID=1641871 RepID=UPI00131ADF9F|nr:ABC transporter permease [Pedobacter sp. L105]
MNIETNKLAVKTWLESAGDTCIFFYKFMRNTFSIEFEWSEFVRQCYEIGYKSFTLVGITSFIMGTVLIIQLRPTMVDFGAESMLPKILTVAIFREIGPVITGIICAGKIASGIGAELGSMKVTEQIDSMEVSGANPMQYLVATRIIACCLMLPLLTILGNLLSLLGGYLAMNFTDKVSFYLYFSKSFNSLTFTDYLPAMLKTVLFGFAIGFVGCYKGYNANRGTASVGIAANSAVVTASLWIFFIDIVVVLITNLLF